MRGARGCAPVVSGALVGDAFVSLVGWLGGRAVAICAATRDRSAAKAIVREPPPLTLAVRDLRQQAEVNATGVM
jgi:hypothetical protein